MLQRSNYKNILLKILYLQLAWYPKSAKFQHWKHWYCMMYHFKELLCINQQLSFLSFFTELWQFNVITNSSFENFKLLSSRFCRWSHINYTVAFCVDELIRLTSMQCWYHISFLYNNQESNASPSITFQKFNSLLKNECERFVPYLISYKLETWVHLNKNVTFNKYCTVNNRHRLRHEQYCCGCDHCSD